MNQMTTNVASTITRAASQQTYWTIRLLVDRDRVQDAYRAYGYFRWVDDVLDANTGSPAERRAFLERQRSLLESCYQGAAAADAGPQERLLVELVQGDHEKNSGLQLYLRNMMRVMQFDAGRRGRLVTEAELNEYTRWLAVAVMEAIHHFIGHDEYSPHDETRYLAVSAAHITHMLRDTFDDLQAGYYNVPREVLEQNHISPADVHSPAYGAWVRGRVELAREYFEAGRRYFARVQNARCRLACFAYIARFDWLLDTLEREDYHLRPQYGERKSIGTGLRMSALAVSSMLSFRGLETPSRSMVSPRHSKP